MSKIAIQRDHTMGLDRARELAKQWQADGTKDLALECDYCEGTHEDILTFKRSGIKGELTVTAISLALNAKLGMMMLPFKDKIEGAINKSVDKLLAKENNS